MTGRLFTALVLILAFASSAFAQITHDTTAQFTEDGTNTTWDTSSFTVGASNSLVVVGLCLWDSGSGNPTASAVALDGTGAAFSEGHAHQQSPDTDHNVYQWYLANVASGSHTLRITKTANDSAALIVSVFAGVATASPLDGTGASNNGTSTTATSGTLASQAQSDSLVVASVETQASSATSTVTQGTNYTVPTNGAWTDGSGVKPVCGQEYRLNPGGTSNNPGFTVDNVGWNEIANAYKIAGGAAPVRSSLLLMGVGK